jgi:CCR4-NOT transcription complex subunit 1
LYRTLVTYLDLQSIDPNDSSTKRSENIYLNYWLQEIPSLISKPNFVTLICYAFDTGIKSLNIPSPSSGFLINLCQLFKLNQAQELVFSLALQSSTHSELQTVAKEHIQRRLPEFIQRVSGGMLRSLI